MRPHANLLVGAFLIMMAIPSTTPAFGAAEAPRLGLADAVRYALEHSPAFDSARRSKDAATWEAENSTARLLPSLDVSATHGYQDTAPSTGSKPWTSGLTLGLTENLYDNGESWTQRKIAGLNREIAVLNELKTRDGITLNVSLQFYRLSLSFQQLEVQQQRHEALKKQFALTEDQYRQGLRTYKDYLRLKTQVQSSEISILTAQQVIRDAQVELQRLMGVPSRLVPSDAPTFEPLRSQDRRPDIPSGTPALEGFYDFRIAQLQRQVNELNEKLTRRKYWPEVYLTGALSYQYSNYLGSGLPDPTNQTSWNALLSVRYNLWDWGIRRRNVEIAEAQQIVASNRLELELIDVRAKLNTLGATLERLRTEFQLSEELLDLSTRSYNLLEEDYRRGKVSYLDFTTGLNDLLTAKLQFLSSYYSVLENVAQYRYYEGTLYEKATPRP